MTKDEIQTTFRGRTFKGREERLCIDTGIHHLLSDKFLRDFTDVPGERYTDDDGVIILKTPYLWA